MKKIVIAGGTLTSANKGCNALTRGTITSLVDKYGDIIDIKLLNYSTDKKSERFVKINEKSIKVVEIPAGGYQGLYFFLKTSIRCITGSKIYNSIIGNQRDILEAIENADIILDISEGDSFSDIYGLKRFLIHSNIKESVIKLKKPLVLLPQTLGPYKSKLVKMRARKIMNKSKFTFARDKISYDVAINDLKVDKNKLKVIPDMAFYMQPDKQDILKDLGITKCKNDIYFGLNVSGLLYSGGYTKDNMFGFKTNYKNLIQQIINWIMKEDKNTKIILVPHVIVKDGGVEDDTNACNIIYNEFSQIYPDRIFFVSRDYHEHELKKIISECDFFIGGRMHACIAGISTNVPTMPTAYSRKFIGIWDGFELGQFVADPREHSEENIMEILKNSYKNREIIKSTLQEKNKNIKSEIRKGLDLVL
ncbi:polysaccharide pyruvyl transferase family protein [Paraclostridium dentum]|uniref:polysaccharide pyruvyl transferase family protein n=1 Tax=Paraclostridium dentum TaxID=2662455 RepID=UPI003B0086FC